MRDFIMLCSFLTVTLMPAIVAAQVAVLKDDGLHVRKSMAYGGTLTDYREKGFEDFTEGADTALDAE